MTRAGAGETSAMSDKPKTENENVEEEDELEKQNGELLPDREVMTVLDPSGAATGGLGPPQLDPIE